MTEELRQLWVDAGEIPCEHMERRMGQLLFHGGDRDLSLGQLKVGLALALLKHTVKRHPRAEGERELWEALEDALLEEWGHFQRQGFQGIVDRP